jgi:hypothetical protein
MPQHDPVVGDGTEFCEGMPLIGERRLTHEERLALTWNVMDFGRGRCMSHSVTWFSSRCSR